MYENEVINCNKCGKEFDYSKTLICPNCNEFQTVEDEDFADGIAYPAHETWGD